MRLSKEIKPKFIFLENVPAITARGGLQVVKEITEIGYDCRWCHVSAGEVGAKHKRERWFLLAYSNSKSGSGLSIRTQKKQPKSSLCVESKKWNNWPKNESLLLGMDDVIPFRLDRTKALGNAVCVEQTKKAFEILMGIK